MGWNGGGSIIHRFSFKVFFEFVDQPFQMRRMHLLYQRRRSRSFALVVESCFMGQILGPLSNDLRSLFGDSYPVLRQHD